MIVRDVALEIDTIRNLLPAQNLTHPPSVNTTIHTL